MRTAALGVALCIGVSAISAVAQSDRSVLAVIADTDMVPTVYETGDLGAVDPNPDTLAVIDLPMTAGTQPRLSQASNSNGGPPGALDLSLDGRFAFVAETLQPRPAGATKFSELAAGNRLRSFDLRASGGPSRVDDIEIGRQPQNIHLNPAGDLLVAMTFDPGRELAFVPIKDGRFGEVVRFGLDLPPANGLVQITSTWVQWHPSGRYLAVNLVDRAQVAFYEVVRDANGSATAVRPWGNRIQTNKFPFVGRFSPDGRYYVTSDLQWGPDTNGFFGVQEGVLTTIRMAPPDTAGDDARHTVPHIALAPWGAETIVFSPDGRLLATANMRGSGKPRSDANHTETSSVSLYVMEPESGRLSRAGEWAFDAVLPQGLAFDRSGNTLYVGVNRYRNDQVGQGAVEAWRVVRAALPSLERTDQRVHLPPGVHTIRIR